MVKISFLILFLLALSMNSKAQSAELIFMGGTSHYLGDLGGKDGLGTNEMSDLDFNTTRYGLGMGLRVRFGDRFALRLNAIYGRVAGDDANTPRLERNARNLSFFSPIFEGSIVGEVYLGTAKRLYFFGGVGNFFFNPKTKYNGKTYELQPLGTEGQNYLLDKNPYDLSALSFPFGIGYRIPVGNNSSLGFEIMLRKTNTDYIDDVSTVYADNAQIVANGGALAGLLADRSNSTIPGFSDEGSIRGDPTDNDNFSFFLVTYSIGIGGKSSDAGFGGSRKRGRKGFFKKGRCFEF